MSAAGLCEAPATVPIEHQTSHRVVRTRPIRALLAALGSIAVEGPVLEWVLTHRKHHRFSGPHGPHLDHAPR